MTRTPVPPRRGARQRCGWRVIKSVVVVPMGGCGCREAWPRETPTEGITIVRTRHAAASALAAAALVAAPVLTVPTGTATAAGTAPVTELYPCRGYGMQDRVNPISDLNRDRFTMSGLGTRVVGNGRHDINWKLDPFKQDSWKTTFHMLSWAGAYMQKSTQGWTAQRDPAAIDNAVAITYDWVRDNPYPWPTGPGAGNATHTRADFMMCLRTGLQKVGKPVPAWLDASLAKHADWLRTNTWKDHNVGTEQTMAVLGIGCTLGRADLRDYAAGKLSRDITRVIDAQGANNEQALNYAEYNHRLWGYVTNALDACDIDTPASRVIQSRRAGLQRFLDFAVKPDGFYHQIGDTQVQSPNPVSPAQQWVLSDGRSGVAPTERVAIYNAGYVFGRSGWGTGARKQSQESAYALRFGPIRTGHGHSDHTAVTWNTLGRPILVDSGTGSYNQDAWRLHYIGPEAHNQLVVAGMRNGSATKLIRKAVKPGADFYQFADTPYLKTTRTRSVLVLSDPDVVVVLDRATSYKPTSFTQYWHLPADAPLTVRGTKATSVKGGVTTTLFQLPAAGVKPTAFGQVKGSTTPILGWYWKSYFAKAKAPVATVTQKGTSAAMVTAVTAAKSPAAAVTTATTGSTTTYTFTVAGKKAVVTLDAAGVLTRVR